MSGMNNPYVAQVATALNTPPKILNNRYSVTGYIPQIVPIEGKQIIVPACTAGVLVTMLNVTGGGVISFLNMQCLDTNPRLARCKITLDGNVIFDSTSASLGTAGKGATFIGASNSTAVELQPIPFNVSLKIEFSSSVTETPGITFGVIYQTI